MQVKVGKHDNDGITIAELNSALQSVIKRKEGRDTDDYTLSYRL